MRDGQTRGLPMTSLKKQISDCVALLNEHVPGWRERIGGATLAMGVANRCVIGQLYGNFNEFLLGKTSAPAELVERVTRDQYILALNVPMPDIASPLYMEMSQERDKKIAALTRAWQKEIQKHQN